jgi:hypothetical protein
MPRYVLIYQQISFNQTKPKSHFVLVSILLKTLAKDLSYIKDDNRRWLERVRERLKERE